MAEPKRVCNHDPRSNNNTLKKSFKTIMVHPKQEDYICTVCHKMFKYEFDIQGTPLLIKD